MQWNGAGKRRGGHRWGLLGRREHVSINVPGNAWNLDCWWINLNSTDSHREAWRVGLRYEIRHKIGEFFKLSSLCCCLIISSDTNIIEERFIAYTHFSYFYNWMLNIYRAHLSDIWSPSKSGSSSFGTKGFSSLPKHAFLPSQCWTSITSALVHSWTGPGKMQVFTYFLGVVY